MSAPFSLIDRSQYLTARQRQIIDLIGRQMRTVDIATTLGIAASTVNKHRNHITQKLRLSTTAQLTAYCLQAAPTAIDDAGCASYPAFAARERQILQLLAQGMTSKEIARRMSLSPRTISEHRHRLMRRFHLRRMVELMALYARIGTAPSL